jgi:hypothetical protein
MERTADDRMQQIDTDREEWMERLELAVSRLEEIPQETRVPEKLQVFFQNEARFLLEMNTLMTDLENGRYRDASAEELGELNKRLYREVLPENYDTCPGNPTYAASLAGAELGGLLSFLYTELRGTVVYAYENMVWDMLVSAELFLEVYHAFTDAYEETQALPDAKHIREILYWYCSDYAAEMVAERTRQMLDPAYSFARDIVMREDLEDLRYLYRYGEYITENEKETAEYLNSLPEEEVESIAKTWTEGYRIGFEVSGKPLDRKKTVNIRYRVGFERVVRCAVKQFEAMGLASVIFRSATHAVNKRQSIRVGYYGAVPNPQFEYDHRNDASLFMDEKFVTRKLQALRQSYENCKYLANTHGGPAVMDVFGETPFLPEANPDAMKMSPEAQKEQVRYNNEAGQITNRYIIGSERSFTIIAYPVPQIGENFREIFAQTVKINNLDYRKYQKIQQKIIDALDQGCALHIAGMKGNCTDLTVQLHKLEDPSRQTNFENCVADVNIPVGEVFTSPVLAGTNGLLHVSRVYLEEFQYKDLRILVKDGMVASYSCANFDSEEENRKYIEENILFHHDTIPMGECAIGTNTTAYRVAKTYGIADKLPILIAEKMGPHFAFGDTCYSWQEDNAVFNPDGKEIIARDNERSILRKTDPSRAYFGCHTDITIPYEELGHIHVLLADGSRIPIIENGRFVLPGCEELNEPLTGLIDD